MARKNKIKYFELYGKNIIIRFEEYYGQKFEDFNEFFISIASKKTYSKIADLIIEENNNILNKNDELAEEFILRYFTIKYKIDTGEYKNTTPTEFVQELITQIFTPEIIKLVQNYVEEKYNTNVDQNMDFANHKYDKGTTFLDRHYKTMYMISSMSRLIIPILTHYIYNEKTITDINTFIMNTFMELFRLIQNGTEMDLYAKLHLFVSRAIDKTRYTDAVMWDRLKILGITPEIVCEDTMNKLVTNVIPKYSFEMNIMNLNTVVIRKSVMSYTLRKKDPYTIYSLSSNDGQASDDDSIASEVEVFDSYNTQRDESVIFFRRYATKHDTEIIRENEGIKPFDPKEVEFYSINRNYHDLQKTIICYIFTTYFSGVENIIGGCGKQTWPNLIIIVKRMLESLGMNYLSEFVSAKRQQYSFKRISKVLDSHIEDSPLYQEIVEKKYKSIKGLFERKNFIKGMIITIINNTYTYNSYGNPRNGEYIEKDEFKIVEEVLKFFNLLIR